MKGNSYTVTGNAFEGVMTFVFDTQGWLVGFNLEEAELTEEQRKWLYPKMPITEPRMATFQKLKNFTVEKGEPDLSFDRFWNVYAMKQKKTVAEKLWNKLSKRDKIAAMKAIRPYNNWLARSNGIAKQLPDTFIRQKRWLDNFNS